MTAKPLKVHKARTVPDLRNPGYQKLLSEQIDTILNQQRKLAVDRIYSLKEMYEVL